MQHTIQIIFIFLASLCYQLTASNGSTQINDDIWTSKIPLDEKYPLEIYLESYDGDYIGKNELFLYKEQVSPLQLGYGQKPSPKKDENVLLINIDEWSFTFVSPHLEVLKQGYYPNGERFSFQKPENPGMNIGAHYCGCNKLSGEFTILDIVYDESNRIVSLALDFIQICERKGYLKGYIRYNSTIPLPSNKNSIHITTYGFNGKWYNFNFGFGNKFKGIVNNLYPICSYGKMNVIAFSAGEYDFEFSAPSGKLTVGKYHNAESFQIAKDETPGMDIYENRNKFDIFREHFKGHFQIIDIEYNEDGSVNTLALDFLQKRKGRKYVAGSIRFNSNLPATPEAKVLEELAYSEVKEDEPKEFDSWEEEDDSEEWDVEEYDEYNPFSLSKFSDDYEYE